MKIITFADVALLNISPLECYKWAEYMIMHKRKCILPPKISMKPAEGVFCNVMPSIIPAEISPLEYSAGGVKVVTRYPGRVPSLDSTLLLFNADTGENLALMDANFITAMRTGAVAAHTIRLLARKDYHILGIMGLGNTARASLFVLAEKYPGRNFHVRLLRHKSQEESFMRRFSEYRNITFECVDSPVDLVKGADVVISAVTYAPEDFCPDECFGAGILVVPVHTLGFTNCDLFFDRVFADDTGHVRHFKNFAAFRNFAEVSDAVNGKSPGRVNDTERILAYNIGISAHDVYFAAQIFRMLTESGKNLTDINMRGPETKFWI